MHKLCGMKKHYFSRYNAPQIGLPPLSEIQINYYSWFFQKGLGELFHEASPIKDFGGQELSLELSGFTLDEPKYNEQETRAKNLSYEAPLRLRARLINKKTNEIKEQEIYLGDIPIMTPRGTFVINGIERVVVSQLIRSSGVYFTSAISRGKKYFGAKIIPNRGAWLEFETDSDGAIYVKIDRKRKIPATSILRMFGMSDTSAIEDEFKDIDIGEIAYIKKTLERDPSTTQNEAFIEIYKRIRPGDLATAATARSLIESMLFR